MYERQKILKLIRFQLPVEFILCSLLILVILLRHPSGFIDALNEKANDVDAQHHPLLLAMPKVGLEPT